MKPNPSKPPENPHKRFGIGMTIAMWVVVLGLLTMFFQSWQEKQFNPNQQLSMQLGKDGERELVLNRNRWGHYVASGMINHQPVVFLLDTGASDISVPEDVADRIGLQRGRPVMYQTANGPMRAYATVLEQVSLGAISLNRVRASINPNMPKGEVLLGMSFLKHIEFTQRGDTLTLRQVP